MKFRLKEFFIREGRDDFDPKFEEYESIAYDYALTKYPELDLGGDFPWMLKQAYRSGMDPKKAVNSFIGAADETSADVNFPYDPGIGAANYGDYIQNPDKYLDMLKRRKKGMAQESLQLEYEDPTSSKVDGDSKWSSPFSGARRMPKEVPQNSAQQNSSDAWHDQECEAETERSGGKDRCKHNDLKDFFGGEPHPVKEGGATKRFMVSFDETGRGMGDEQMVAEFDSQGQAMDFIQQQIAAGKGTEDQWIIDDHMNDVDVYTVNKDGFEVVDEATDESDKLDTECPECGGLFSSGPGHPRMSGYRPYQDCPHCGTHFDENEVEGWAQTMWPKPGRGKGMGKPGWGMKEATDDDDFEKMYADISKEPEAAASPEEPEINWGSMDDEEFMKNLTADASDEPVAKRAAKQVNRGTEITVDELETEHPMAFVGLMELLGTVEGVRVWRTDSGMLKAEQPDGKMVFYMGDSPVSPRQGEWHRMDDKGSQDIEDADTIPGYTDDDEQVEV